MHNVVHKDDSLSRATDAVVAQLSKHMSSPLLFLVSGGSAFSILNMIPKDVLGPHITIGVLDERFSIDPLVNNFCQLSSLLFFKHATNAGCAFIDTCVYFGDTIDIFADRFEATLREWKSKYPEGHSIITQGVGSDGHTAGIMPFPEDPSLFSKLFEGDRWIVGYDAGVKNQYPLRVTVTNTFLRTIDHSIMFVVGEEKKEPLRRVYSRDGTLSHTPARIMREMRDVVIITDQSLSDSSLL